MKTVYTPPFSESEYLGITLPSLLDDVCRSYPNPTAFNQPTADGWKSYSNSEFKTIAEELAAGLTDLGVNRGDRVGFFLKSDVDFAFMDMGCLISGAIDVPMYLTSPPANITYILNHVEARVLVVADPEKLKVIVPLIPELPHLETIILAQGFVPAGVVPDKINVLQFDQLRANGKALIEKDPDLISALKKGIDARDTATIIYTSGTTGVPKGVVLTHENISHNAIVSMRNLEGFEKGTSESNLAFLPVTHIFARTALYGAMAWGTSTYFSHPDNVKEHFQDVRPTLFASVPRVLEKVYDRIMVTGMELTGVKKGIFKWSMGVGGKFSVNGKKSRLFKAKMAVADKLVFEKWRAALGGKTRFVIVGGAAISTKLTNIFCAAGINILQGYGLTETSPAVTINRWNDNVPGTVGTPVAGVEVGIADDGEILTRGPNVMWGYYRNPEATKEAINEDGWFHTGDIGAFTDDGKLKITDRKKALFKLSTGKYVIPQPIENELVNDILIEQAVVLGLGRKYAGALIFPAPDALKLYATSIGLDPDMPYNDLINDHQILSYMQDVIDRANKGQEHWCAVKKFMLIPEIMTIENEFLTPSMKVKRAVVNKNYAHEIDALYQENSQMLAST